jgi:hypothetical protein
VYENRQLKTVFGPKRGEVAGGWRKLHMSNYELHNLYCSPNIMTFTSKRLLWAVNAARMGDMRNLYRNIVGQTAGKIPSET